MAIAGITDTKTMEAESLSTHEETEFFINSIPSILVSVDVEGRIRRWNSAAARTFGLRSEAVLGKSLDSCGIHWLCPNFALKLKSLYDTTDQARLDFQFEKEGAVRQLGLKENLFPLCVTLYVKICGTPPAGTVDIDLLTPPRIEVLERVEFASLKEVRP